MIKPVVEFFWTDDELERELEYLCNNKKLAMDDVSYNYAIAKFIDRLSRKSITEISKCFILEDLL
jgi:hypothetical protein